MTPLANRSNSLTFTEIHSIRNRFLAIADSEKALLKADLEADLKYKQLIHEAETILVSIKTTKNSSSLRYELKISYYYKCAGDSIYFENKFSQNY